MKIKSIKQVKSLAGKKVILRADFNVPLKGDKVLDDFKIETGLKTIRYLLGHRCRIVIITHLGRPGGKRSKRYSVLPVVLRLSKLLNHDIKFVPEAVGLKTGTKVSMMKGGNIIFLENIRFYKGELENNKSFAKKLAQLGDVYVNDAFAVSHRAQASVAAIKRYLPSYAGLLLVDEVHNLRKILHPEKPLMVIIGGAKIRTKLSLLKNLAKNSERILVGGMIANNFLASLGYEIGKSEVNKEGLKIAKKIKTNKIILPIDVVVGKRRDGAGTAVAKSVNNIKKDDFIFDIGPKTIRLYASFIKKAKTIVWNGPMGLFEKDHFKHGTLSVARVVASRSRGAAYGVVGGGETVEALKMTKMDNYVDWVSTGGGAMLAYLGGKKMPGLKGIVK